MADHDSLQIWESIYQAGQRNNYPWDNVVSFVFRNAPKDRPRDQVSIVEVGFGTASNLWFAAREGFAVSGVEGSETAVEYARNKFSEEGLTGDLRVGDFTKLPFADDSFDLAIDRAALCCIGRKSHIRAISEIERVLKPGGKFQYNTYADSHSSYRTGLLGPDGLRIGIDGGTLKGIGPIYCTSRSDIEEFFADWKLIKVERKEVADMLDVSGEVHAEWLVLAEKQ